MASKNRIRSFGTTGGLTQSPNGLDTGGVSKPNTGGPGNVALFIDQSTGIGSSSWTKERDLKCLSDGTYTVSFALKANVAGKTASGRIYVNGIAVGTTRTNTTTTYIVYTENISIQAGDNLQLYGYSPDGTALYYITDFKVSALNNPLFTVIV